MGVYVPGPLDRFHHHFPPSKNVLRHTISYPCVARLCKNLKSQFISTTAPLPSLPPSSSPFYQTAQGFTQGVQNVMAFAKEAFVKIKDPQQTAATIAKMAADPNPAIQDLFRRAQAGDSKAVEELQDVFNDLHFPGVNVRVLRQVAENHTFDKLLGMPEIMRFIDRDETLSKLFRSDIKETFSFKGQDNEMFWASKEQAASGKFTMGGTTAAEVMTATTTTAAP